MMHKSFNILRTSFQNQPKWCPGALRRRPRKRVGEMSVTFLKQMSPSLRNGRFWPPFWDSAGRPAGPKIHFLAPSLPKSLKNEFQNEVSEQI